MEGKVAIIQEGSDCSSLIPHPHLQFPAADGVRTVRYETIYSRCCKAIKLYTDYRWSIRIKRQNGEKRKKKKKRKKSIVWVDLYFIWDLYVLGRIGAYCGGYCSAWSKVATVAMVSWWWNKKRTEFHFGLTLHFSLIFIGSHPLPPPSVRPSVRPYVRSNDTSRSSKIYVTVAGSYYVNERRFATIRVKRMNKRRWKEDEKKKRKKKKKKKRFGFYFFLLPEGILLWCACVQRWNGRRSRIGVNQPCTWLCGDGGCAEKELKVAAAEGQQSKLQRWRDLRDRWPSSYVETGSRECGTSSPSSSSSHRFMTHNAQLIFKGSI